MIEWRLYSKEKPKLSGNYVVVLRGICEARTELDKLFSVSTDKFYSYEGGGQFEHDRIIYAWAPVPQIPEKLRCAPDHLRNNTSAWTLSCEHLPLKSGNYLTLSRNIKYAETRFDRESAVDTERFFYTEEGGQFEYSTPYAWAPIPYIPDAFMGAPEDPDIAETGKENESPAILLQDLDLSAHAYNALHRNGARTIQDAVDRYYAGFGSIRNLGPKSKAEIVARLKEGGYISE